MVHVGLTYDIGQRVAKDQAESLRWYRKAADLGDANGMWFVGMAYRFGNGVAKDQTEAASWYRKAAERGNTTAMAGLAEMYKAARAFPRMRARQSAGALRLTEALRRPTLNPQRRPKRRSPPPAPVKRSLINPFGRRPAAKLRAG